MKLTYTSSDVITLMGHKKYFFRCGSAGSVSPHHIIPTSITIDGEVFVQFFCS
jgi:hypothetical protein